MNTKSYPKAIFLPFLRKYIAFSLCFLLFACHKNITEESIVFDYAETDHVNADTVYSISFPSLDAGFASTNNGIFKTTNQGSNWLKKSDENGGEVFFHNELYGVHSDGLITQDGGETWIDLGSNVHAAAINSSGETIVLIRHNSFTGSLWKTDALGTQLTFMIQTNSIYIDGVKRLRCSDDYVYMVPHDFISYNVYAFKMSDATDYFQFEGHWNSTEEPTDLCVFDSQIIMCGKQGSMHIGYEPDDQFTETQRQYFKHNLDYYSVDCDNGMIVAVGNKSILTNKTLGIEKDLPQFKEVLTTDLKSIDFKCYQVDIIDPEHIAVIGEDGKIYIGSI